MVRALWKIPTEGSGRFRFGIINYKRKAINFRVWNTLDWLGEDRRLLDLFHGSVFPIDALVLHLFTLRSRTQGDGFEREKRQWCYHSHRYQVKQLTRNTDWPISCRSDRDVVFNHEQWFEKIVHFYQAPIVRFFYYIVIWRWWKILDRKEFCV